MPAPDLLQGTVDVLILRTLGWAALFQALRGVFLERLRRREPRPRAHLTSPLMPGERLRLANHQRSFMLNT